MELEVFKGAISSKVPPPCLFLSSYSQNSICHSKEIRNIYIRNWIFSSCRVKVQKREGKENENLLHPDSEMDEDQDQGQREDDSGKGFWGNLFGKKSDQGGGAPSSMHETNGTADSLEINIFSVASGHLYERFLRIMILSVLENTDSPVKFWFIKNYLSPKFKDVIPYMSKRYGFNYELITYKWPSFLNKQTDKIRIIWANKILFLDVLFPINLKKVGVLLRRKKEPLVGSYIYFLPTH